MFFVITKRVVKVNTGSKERFSPRSNNVESWTVSGPITKKSLAERAAVSALGTHTCLTAMVLSVDQLEAALKVSYSSHFASDAMLEQALRKAIALHCPKVEA